MKGLAPFFSYFGAKFRLAQHYPAPVYDHILEPFAGAAGYSSLYYNRKITLVERDERQAAMWRYLIKVKASEIMALPLIEPSQDLYELKCCEEAKFLIGFNLAKATRSGVRQLSSWSIAKIGNNTDCWSATMRARIASQVSLIRHWKLIEGDYTSCPDVKGTYFLDPPYQKAGKDYRYDSSRIDFDMLGLWCMRRRGQIMVCENMPADWLPFKPFRTMTGQRKDSVEVLYHSHRD